MKVLFMCLALALLIGARAAAGPILVEPVSVDQNAVSAAAHENAFSRAFEVPGVSSTNTPPVASSVERMLKFNRHLSIVDPATASKFEYQGTPEKGAPAAEECAPDRPDQCAHAPEPATLFTLAAGLFGARMLARRKVRASH